jgi:hypothetical protein
MGLGLGLMLGLGLGPVAGARVGAGGEVGYAAFQKKERQKTSKLWNDFSSITVNGVRKSQCHWCKGLFVVRKSSDKCQILHIWAL